ncbi:MAG: hypothetical protein J0H09_05145 [Burkholderiales bacterium]|nr:hypothetical protein [Burkholderiales bacterium]
MPLLFEHDDGRYAVADTAALADFCCNDPAWHRLGPIAIVRRADEGPRQAAPGIDGETFRQISFLFHEVASSAAHADEVCYYMAHIESLGHAEAVIATLRGLIERMGWLADRGAAACGISQIRGDEDQWLMPSAWKPKESPRFLELRPEVSHAE